MRDGQPQEKCLYMCPFTKHLELAVSPQTSLWHEQHQIIKKGTLHHPSFNAMQVRAWPRAALAQFTHMEQVTTASFFPHRWVSNRSFPPLPLVFGWGHLTAWPQLLSSLQGRQAPTVVSTGHKSFQ